MSVMTRPGTGLAQGAEAGGAPSSRTVPFDYVFRIPITGSPGTRSHELINVSTVGMFVVTSIGYSLQIDAPFGPEIDIGRGPASSPGLVLLPEIVPAPDAPSGTTFRLYGPRDAEMLLYVKRPQEEEESAISGQIGSVVLGQLDEKGRAFNRFTLDKASGWVVGDSITVVPAESKARAVTVRTFPLDKGWKSVAPFGIAPQFGPELPAIAASKFEVAGLPSKQVDLSVYGQPEPNAGLRPATRERRDAYEREPRLRLRRKDLGQDGTARLDLTTAEEGLDAKTPARKKVLAGDRLTLTYEKDGYERFEAAFVPDPLDLRLADIPRDALARGFRLTPTVASHVLANGPVPPIELLQPFDRCGAGCDDFKFLYGIFDNGTGRAYQNQMIHNIAGLGTPSGDRPFRFLPTPIVLEPRTVLRFEIEELAGGPGTLHVDFQGYKVIGSGRGRLP